MRKKLLLSAILGLVLGATPAIAAHTGPSHCSVTDISPTALACAGFFSGNLLSGSPADRLAQQSALASIGFNWDGDFSQVTKIDNLAGLMTVDFSTADQNPLLQKMYGNTWVGVHFGVGAGMGDQVTGFWKLDAGLAGLQSFTLNMPGGSSGAVLYETGLVPEPESWALLIVGFGLVGAVMRRRRQDVVAA